MNRIPVLQPSTARTRAALLVASFVLLLASVFPVAEAHAQVVFDNFDDGDVGDVGAFSETGGGIGVGPTDGANGSASGLSIGVNPADIGGFAGFVIPGGDGTTDVSSATHLSFYVNSNTQQAGNVPFTLEINLHEDVNGNGTYEGGTEDEYQAVYRLEPGSGYTLVQIPLASFGDDNAVFPGLSDGFDFANLLEVVVAFAGVQGPEFAFALDEVAFVSGLAPLTGSSVALDNFDDGDVGDVGAFSETGGGIGVGPTDGANGSASGLSIGVNPADIGGFAGFVIPGGDGTTDVSSATHLSFYVNSNTQQAGNVPFTLEINLHEDVDGNGTYEGGTEDEYQAVYRLEPGSGYTLVQIPLASFGDDNAVFPGLSDGFDFANLLEVVVAFAGVQGPEFAFAIDEVSFLSAATGTAIETEEVPDSYTLTNAYPNPFNPQASFGLTLVRPQQVRIAVYDVLGRQVALLHEGMLAAQTRHTFQIDARDWSSGIYLYRVTGEAFSETRSVVLTK